MVSAFSGAGALLTELMQWNGPVGNDDPERRADRPLHQIDLPAMGTDQFGGDRKAKPGAAVTR